MDEGAINSLVDLWLLLETMSNLLGEIKTKVADGLSLKNFLRLVELLTHEGVEVIVENEVFKLGKLLRKQLLLNLVQNVVGLIIFKVSAHVNLLFELD
jgi:hypothetical protein